MAATSELGIKLETLVTSIESFVDYYETAPTGGVSPDSKVTDMSAHTNYGLKQSISDDIEKMVDDLASAIRKTLTVI